MQAPEHGDDVAGDAAVDDERAEVVAAVETAVRDAHQAQIRRRHGTATVVRKADVLLPHGRHRPHERQQNCDRPHGPSVL